MPKNGEAKRSNSTCQALGIFPVLFLLLLSHWIRALRWKMLIEPPGYRPSNINTFFGVMVGYRSI
jgi:hypothetical protein